MFSTTTKIVPVTSIRQLNFDKTITMRFFYVKVSLRILSNIVTVYFVSYKIGLVQPTFQQKFSVGCFLELSQKHVIFVVNLPNKFSLIHKWKDT